MGCAAHSNLEVTADGMAIRFAECLKLETDVCPERQPDLSSLCSWFCSNFCSRLFVVSIVLNCGLRGLGLCTLGLLARDGRGSCSKWYRSGDGKFDLRFCGRRGCGEACFKGFWGESTRDFAIGVCLGEVFGVSFGVNCSKTSFRRTFCLLVR
jgi:hypothetical protein